MKKIYILAYISCVTLNLGKNPPIGMLFGRKLENPADMDMAWGEPGEPIGRFWSCEALCCTFINIYNYVQEYKHDESLTCITHTRVYNP